MPLFKNIIVFRLAADSTMPAESDLDQVLQKNEFSPCQPMQEVSAGWVSPSGEDHSPFLANVGGHFIVKLAVERKSVPASAVKALVEEKVEEITQMRGKAPGRKEKKEIKEQAYFDLLPRAFSKRSAHLAWIDVKNGFLVVGCGSMKAADLVVDAVVQAVAEAGGTLKLTTLETVLSPSTAMSQWLSTKEAPADFSIDQDLELKDLETKSTVRYAKHSLELDEIVEHIAQGKVPTQLAMTWDGRVSFMLTSALVIKRIETLERVFDDSGRPEDFAGNVALATGELSGVIPAVIAALGGEPSEDTPAEGSEE